MLLRQFVVFVGSFAVAAAGQAADIRANNRPARLDIRPAGKNSIRVTLKPIDFKPDFPFNPALTRREYGAPSLSLQEISRPVKAQVGGLNVEVRPTPLTVIATAADGQPIQDVVFQDDGNLSFRIGGQLVLGMGEGGPMPRGTFRTLPIEFDRRGRFEDMRPRWQSDAYGSRNPVALLIGTEGWGLLIATPWGQVDLRDHSRGVFSPWQPPPQALPRGEGRQDEQKRGKEGNANLTAQLQGRPPVESIVPGAYDLFLFDAHDPTQLMKDISVVSGPAVMPPKWSLGYMQSHRELVDRNLSSEALLLNAVDTFREKRIPLDAVIYLGTGFTPTGWNTRQPSFNFNPRVFQRNAKEVLDDLHAKHVKAIVHIVPWQRDRLPSLQGTIPASPGEARDASHIEDYWGSDTGGFYTTSELTGELYARWFQFSAFCPSFRSHGRIWRLRMPWGWGLSDMGSLEGQNDLPRQSEMNNSAIEPICRKYAELRYRLIPYTYTLAAEARETGLPPMRAMWLHYPHDEKLRGMGTQYLWSRDLLIAPVFKQGAATRDVYLPDGVWYDWWSGEKETGRKTIIRNVDLETMPIYIRAGAVILFDPVRQYMSQPVDEPTTIRVYSGVNGWFRWYEDDGISQEYLDGKFAWTNLQWDDAARRLTIERDTAGGTLERTARKLAVQVLPHGASIELNYDGSRAEVSF